MASTYTADYSFTTGVDRVTSALGGIGIGPLILQSYTGQVDGIIWRVQVSLNGAKQQRDWFDITTLVRNFSFATGRNDELQEFSTCQLTVELSNASGVFTPGQSSFAIPGRPFRVIAETQGVQYIMVTGYADDWSVEYPLNGRDAIAIVDCSGAFMFLQNARSDTFLDPQYTSDRVIQMVSEVGGIEVLVDSAGTIVMPELELYETEVLSVIRAAGSTEFGQLYESRGGGIIFSGRAKRFEQTGTKIVFGDNLVSESPYEDAAWMYSQNKIYNRVQVTADPDNPQTILDLNSATKYGTKQFSLDIDAQNSLDDAGFNDTYAESLARFIAGRYSEPALRVNNLGLHLGGRSELWDKLLSLNINDRVVVRRRPPGYTPELTTSTSRTTRFGLFNLGGDDVLYDLSAENAAKQLNSVSTTWTSGNIGVTNYNPSNAQVLVINDPVTATDGENHFQYKYTFSGTETTTTTSAALIYTVCNDFIPVGQIFDGASLSAGEKIYFWIEVDSLGGTITTPSGNNSARFYVEPIALFYSTAYQDMGTDPEPFGISGVLPAETTPTTTLTIPSGTLCKRVECYAKTLYASKGNLGYIKVGLALWFSPSFTFVAGTQLDFKFDDVRVYGGRRSTEFTTINGTSTLGATLGSSAPTNTPFPGWVDTREPSVGTRINRECFVEQIRHDVSPGQDSWKMTLGLSDAITGAYWALDSSRLGVDTRLGI
jgi:hypothetical protein